MTSASRAEQPGDSGLLGVIAARLCSHRAELEDSILTSVLHAVKDPVVNGDADVIAETRDLIALLIQSFLVAIQQDTERPAAVTAAGPGYRALRAGVQLSSGVHRDTLTHALLWDYVFEEVNVEGSATADQVMLLKGAWFAGRAVLATHLAAMTEAYMLEARQSAATSDQRRLQLAKCLLAGQRVDAEALCHPLDVLHVGVVASGVGVGELIKLIGAQLCSRVLVVSHPDGVVWAWLSGRDHLRTVDLARRLAADASDQFKLGIGEPAAGRGGFRLSYRQANAAFSVAQLRIGPVARYAEVTLLAHAVQDATLARSLIDVHLAPLGSAHEGGEVLRQTLRAYFEAGRNGSAAAVSLKVDRSTVRHRLDLVEERLGRTLYSQQAELEVALALEQLPVTLWEDENGGSDHMLPGARGG